MSLKVSSLTVDSVPCGISSVQPHLAAEDTSGAHTTHIFASRSRNNKNQLILIKSASFAWNVQQSLLHNFQVLIY